MAFSFICAFLDHASAYGGQPLLMGINTIYSDIVNKPFYGSSNINMLNQKSFPVVEGVAALKVKAKYNFGS